MVLRCASEAGLLCLCVREIQRSIADSVKQLLEAKIAEYGLEDFFRSTETEITGRNGSRIIFRGMQNHTAAQVKSLEGAAVCWVEEAQTISHRSLELLIPTIRADGSELWFSWNPESDDDPVDVLLRKDPPKDALVKWVNWDDNPYFPGALRNDMERDRDRDPDKWAHVWQGEYRSASETRVFRNFREGELDPPENVVWFYGLDFGFSTDPTACVRFCILGDRTLYIDQEAYETGTPTESLPALIGTVEGSAKWPMRADNARPETIDYLRRHGFPKIRACRKGKGSVEDGVMFLQSMDIVIHPRCGNTLREFRTYAYKTDPRTNEILPVIEDKNNHAIDAIRYGAEGLHRKGRLIQAPAPVPTDNRLERPPDYRSRRETADSWKTA